MLEIIGACVIAYIGMLLENSGIITVKNINALFMKIWELVSKAWKKKESEETS